MKRYEIINRIIESKGYQDYLEIGVRDGECFKEICCKNKTGVDPYPASSHTTHKMESDDFFSSLESNVNFDIIFIDGLHLDFQVDKDIQNSLKHLKEGGTILLHDCNPPTPFHADTKPYFSAPANGEWNGTVYLSLIKLRLYNSNVKLRTVNTDWGVGILTKELSENINAFPDLATSWDYFDSNREVILDLITPDIFMESYPLSVFKN